MSQPFSFTTQNKSRSNDDDRWAESPVNVPQQKTRLTKYGSNSEEALPSRRSTRLKKSTETLSVDDDSDDESDDGVLETSAKTALKSDTFEPSRIAIGKSISHGTCEMSFSGSTLIIKCRVQKGRKTRASSEKELVDSSHRIHLQDILDMKYYTPAPKGKRSALTDQDEDDLKPFFAVRAKKTIANSLESNLFSNTYKPDGRDSESKYILIEFQEHEALDGVFAWMMTCEKGWGVYTEPECKLNSKHDATKYAASLIASTSTATLTVRRRGKQAYPFLANKDVILVYPFDGDHKEMEHAARDLTCLGGSDEAFLKEHLSRGAIQEAGQGSGANETSDSVPVKKIGSGTVTLRPDDFLLLEPEEWLNDNLIDFALRWISRHSEGTGAHFFSTHFYTKLADQGTGAVASWTIKRNRELNIFDLKMIFIPINKSLHWSLCVVVNPGSIKHFSDLLEAESDLSSEDSDLPCLLFFDSLKSHNKAQVVSITVGMTRMVEKRSIDSLVAYLQLL
jgi:sentrin-specific protease 7